jgi:hypothetical protein
MLFKCLAPARRCRAADGTRRGGTALRRWEQICGAAMPFVVYLVILVTAVFSVALEWDTLVAPSSTTWHEMQAVGELGKPAAQHDAVQPPPAAAPQQPQPKTAAAPPPTSVAAPPKAADDTLAQKAAAAPPPACDVNACASAYFTFRASDCTYQPSFGPRRLCTKGAPEAAEAQAVGTAPAVPGCHVRACAESYSSFNPQDCTYQPLEGPRQLCKK